MGTQQVTQQLSPELQKIADELKQQEQAGQTGSQAGEEVSISLETGQVYKGKNWEEVAQKIADAQRSASEKIREQTEELTRLRESGGAPKPAEPAQAGFDTKRYWDLMSEDPRRAGRYALAADLGIAEEQLPNVLKGAISTTQNLVINAEIAKFRQDCLDYPATEEAMNKMLERGKAAGRIHKLPNGTEYMSGDEMKLTWYELRENGTVKPLELEKKSADNNAGGDVPPPSLTGGGGGTNDPLAAAEEKLLTLPSEKAEALLKELGLK